MEIWLEPGDDMFFLLFIFNLTLNLEIHAPIMLCIVALNMSDIFGLLLKLAIIHLFDTDEDTPKWQYRGNTAAGSK